MAAAVMMAEESQRETEAETKEKTMGAHRDYLLAFFFSRDPDGIKIAAQL